MKKNYGPTYTAPIAVWTTLFFLVPNFIILIYSFLKRGLRGGVEWEFTLEAYKTLLNPVLAKVAFTTLWIAVLSTLITVLIALPCAYYMARSKFKNLLLFLVIIPFWTNFLIRIYAWIAILGNNGFLNQALMALGITDHYIQLLYNQGAVIIVSVYTYLPFAILPLYSTTEKFDFSLLEAARDLGASNFRAIVSVLLPNIKGGIVTAILFTFIPTFGAYAIPQLVGDKNSYMLGNIIADELRITRNWPLASAISMIITLVSTVSLLIFVWRNSRAAASQPVVREEAGESAS